MGKGRSKLSRTAFKSDLVRSAWRRTRRRWSRGRRRGRGRGRTRARKCQCDAGSCMAELTRVPGGIDAGADQVACEGVAKVMEAELRNSVRVQARVVCRVVVPPRGPPHRGPARSHTHRPARARARCASRHHLNLLMSRPALAVTSRSEPSWADEFSQSRGLEALRASREADRPDRRWTSWWT